MTREATQPVRDLETLRLWSLWTVAPDAARAVVEEAGIDAGELGEDVPADGREGHAARLARGRSRTCTAGGGKPLNPTEA